MACGSAATAIIVLIIAILLILFLIYGGFNLWHWFGNTTNVTVNTTS